MAIDSKTVINDSIIGWLVKTSLQPPPVTVKNMSATDSNLATADL